MKLKSSAVVLFVLLLISTGCAYRTVFKAEELTALTAMKEPQADDILVSHFEESRWNHFFFWGFVPTCEPNLKGMLGYAPVVGYEIRNLQITNEVNFANLLVIIQRNFKSIKELRKKIR
jgi:hypothetical protein